MLRPYSALLLVCLALGTTGCAANQSGVSDDDEAGPTVNIENRSSLDMDMYVRTERLTSPLGFAPGGETTRFRLSRAVLAGSSLVRFEARPVRGQGQRVQSEPFAVKAGEEVTWSIPPQ
jgi:hypothetical protein